MDQQGARSDSVVRRPQGERGCDWVRVWGGSGAFGTRDASAPTAFETGGRPTEGFGWGGVASLRPAASRPPPTDFGFTAHRRHAPPPTPSLQPHSSRWPACCSCAPPSPSPAPPTSATPTRAPASPTSSSCRSRATDSLDFRGRLPPRGGVGLDPGSIRLGSHEVRLCPGHRGGHLHPTLHRRPVPGRPITRPHHLPFPFHSHPLSHPLGSDSKVQFDKALSHPGGAFFGLPLIVSATVRGNSSATPFLL